MSLKSKLQGQGSNLTKWDGTNPSTNLGATKQSTLHGVGVDYGYSTSGHYFVQTNLSSNLYDNGSPKTFPLGQPSNLDMAGGAKISEPTYGHTQNYDHRQGKKYEDNLPG
jgi:hypothetical protein